MDLKTGFSIQYNILVKFIWGFFISENSYRQIQYKFGFPQEMMIIIF